MLCHGGANDEEWSWVVHRHVGFLESRLRLEVGARKRKEPHPANPSSFPLVPHRLVLPPPIECVRRRHGRDDVASRRVGVIAAALEAQSRLSVP